MHLLNFDEIQVWWTVRELERTS